MRKRQAFGFFLLIILGSVVIYRSALANNDSSSLANCTFEKDEVALIAATVNVAGKPEVRLRWMTKRGVVPGVTFNLYRVGADQKSAKLNTEPLGSSAGTVSINASNSRVSDKFNYKEILTTARRPLAPHAQIVVDSTPMQRLESGQTFIAMRDTIKQLRSQQVRSPGLTTRAFGERVIMADGMRPYMETLSRGANLAAPTPVKRDKPVDRMESVKLSPEEETRRARATLQLAAMVHSQIAHDLGYAFEDQTAQTGVVYTYQLKSIENGQECDVPVAISQITVGNDQPLAPVTNLMAAQADEDSIDLRWSRPADEDKLSPTYKITRIDSKGTHESSQPIVIADIKLRVPQNLPDGRRITHIEPRSFYHDRGVTPGKVTYSVVVTDIFGRSSPPATIDFTMEDWHTPQQVAKIWAELKGKDVRVSWTASADKGVAYRIYRVDAEKADAKPELLTTAPVAGEPTVVPEEIRDLLTRSSQTGVQRREMRSTRRPDERAAASNSASETWLAYSDKNVQNDHSYKYLVTAVFQNGNDMDSAATYSKVLPVPVTTLLAGPANLKMQLLPSLPQFPIAKRDFEIPAAKPRETNYGGVIELSWENVAGAKFYRIYRANASGYFDQSKVSAASLKSGASPQIRAQAPPQFQQPQPSKEAKSGKVESALIQQSGVSRLREIQVSKVSPSKLRYLYNMDESDIPDSAYALVGQVMERTTFYDNFPRSQATTYVYRVVAVNRWNVPAAGMVKGAKYSSIKAHVPATLPPSTPVLLSVTSDKDGYLQLLIQGGLENEGIVRYHIFRRDLPVTTAIAQVATQSSPNNLKINSPMIQVAHPVSNAIVKTPIVRGSGFQLSTLMVQHDGYEELTTLKVGESKLIAANGQLTFRDDTVLPMHEYFYYVVADNGDAKYSSKPSNILKDIPPHIRADAPTFLKASIGLNGGVVLGWPSTTSDAVYVIERASATGAHFAQLDGASAKTNYTDHSALRGHTYIYRVIAIEKTGAISDPSAYPLDKLTKNPDAYPARVKFTVPAVKAIVNTQ